MSLLCSFSLYGKTQLSVEMHHTPLLPISLFKLMFCFCDCDWLITVQ